jgi:hypothetical protein
LRFALEPVDEFGSSGQDDFYPGGLGVIRGQHDLYVAETGNQADSRSCWGLS